MCGHIDLGGDQSEHRIHFCIAVYEVHNPFSFNLWLGIGTIDFER